MGDPSPLQNKRKAVTGILGTRLGVLNSSDAEVLANKLSLATSDFCKLE